MANKGKQSGRLGLVEKQTIKNIVSEKEGSIGITNALKAAADQLGREHPSVLNWWYKQREKEEQGIQSPTPHPTANGNGKQTGNNVSTAKIVKQNGEHLNGNGTTSLIYRGIKNILPKLKEDEKIKLIEDLVEA